MDDLAEEVQAAGRSAADVPVSMSMTMQGGRGGRYGLGTEPGEIVEKLQAFQRLGVATVVISAYTGDVQGMMRGLEMLAQDVMPALSQAG
jgi:hypothetical protein